MVRTRKSQSAPEEMLAFQLKASHIKFVREFCPFLSRRFRFDFKLSDTLLVEVQGGIWNKGGHSSGIGITRDCEKYSLAAAHGYRVILVTPAQIKAGLALTWIEQALAYAHHT